jgi:uncharacterized protein (TIGR02217 family)
VKQTNDRIFYNFQVEMAVMSQSQQDKVERLFITHQGFSGSANNVRFLFKDPDDNSQSGVSFGTGDGSTKKFQIKSEYTFGSQTETFPQGHIDEGTLTVKEAGSEVDDANYGINYNTGIIEFDSAPADGNDLKATYEFFKLCQFRDSETTAEAPNAVTRNQTVELVEVAG